MRKGEGKGSKSACFEAAGPVVLTTQVQGVQEVQRGFQVGAMPCVGYKGGRGGEFAPSPSAS